MDILPIMAVIINQFYVRIVLYFVMLNIVISKTDILLRLITLCYLAKLIMQETFSIVREECTEINFYFLSQGDNQHLVVNKFFKNFRHKYEF